MPVVSRESSGGAVIAQTVSLVTGANRGLGLELCRQLAGRGGTVYLSGRDLAQAERAAQALNGERAVVRPVQLDVRDERSVRELAREIAREAGRLDLLINNAAVSEDASLTGTTADLAILERTFATNTVGAWRVTQAMLPLLRRAPAPALINISSTMATEQGMGASAPAYRASKAALNLMTRSLATELDNVDVYAVCPGWLATDMGGPQAGPVAPGAADVLWVAFADHGIPSGSFIHAREVCPW